MGALYDRLTYVNGTTPAMNGTNMNKPQTFLDFLDKQLYGLDDQDLTYTDGALTNVKEYQATKLVVDSTLSYTTGVLTGVNLKYYDTDGVTIQYETNGVLSYASGSLTNVAWTEV